MRRLFWFFFVLGVAHSLAGCGNGLTSYENACIEQYCNREGIFDYDHCVKRMTEISLNSKRLDRLDR